MQTTLKRPRGTASDALVAVGTSLAKKLQALGQPAKPILLARALHELLDGQDAATKALRMAMQIHLAQVSNEAVANDGAAHGNNEEMLSTEAAAQLMGCSRPYVAMLIDADTLAGGVKSKGGHRKVPKSSVLQWMEAQAATKGGAASDTDYRQAAADAGMYAVPDAAYVKGAARSRRGAN